MAESFEHIRIVARFFADTRKIKIFIRNPGSTGRRFSRRFETSFKTIRNILLTELYRSGSYGVILRSSNRKESSLDLTATPPSVRTHYEKMSLTPFSLLHYCYPELVRPKKTDHPKPKLGLFSDLGFFHRISNFSSFFSSLLFSQENERITVPFVPSSRNDTTKFDPVNQLRLTNDQTSPLDYYTTGN